MIPAFAKTDYITIERKINFVPVNAFKLVHLKVCPMVRNKGQKSCQCQFTYNPGDYYRFFTNYYIVLLYTENQAIKSLIFDEKIPSFNITVRKKVFENIVGTEHKASLFFSYNIFPFHQRIT